MLSAYTGTSDGGMVAQVYVQKYPGETGDSCLSPPAMSHLRGEGPEEAAYAQDMFETIFRGYRQEKDDYFSEKMQRDLIRLMH